MKWIVGIDEVGRGALAGPVVVAAALVPASARRTRNNTLGTLKDSKKLSAKQREAWVRHLRSHPEVHFELARIYPRNIERLNISAAANLAAERAVKRLLKRHGRQEAKIFLDGGLYVGNGKQPRNAKTIIKGDEKIHAIAIASILAKVSRDRAMVRLAKKYKAYGFEVHKGYATKAHCEALKNIGAAPVHRATFLGKLALG